ncbi:uncharacterized protein MONBRDRAFT_9453 [Monosiga brevicollis MX1]|uniref:DNA helicase n=1 Tax=Monosiga brevicollis TaxID=81824 RepID=A9V374_MONBE|nr:uncharacterized protein MONBRDRAFT_9453 [Monosiga brevicollis MX1]EDQ88139.1 predicted protein [Monosiga brevicollis MX1]|eukprot:XP_001747215.1 hypothetical protein [Monosiga brevicollis MX1]
MSGRGGARRGRGSGGRSRGRGRGAFRGARSEASALSSLRSQLSTTGTCFNDIDRRLQEEECPACPGWNLYFAPEPYDDGFPYRTLIQECRLFFEQFSDHFYQKSVEEHHVVIVCFDRLQTFLQREQASQDLDPLSEEMREDAPLIMRCIGLAFWQAYATARNAQREQIDLVPHWNWPCIDVRVSRFGPITPLRKLKSNVIGKFVGIKGTVVRVGSVKPLPVRLCFICNHCGEETVLALAEGKYATPSKCATDGCQSRSFVPSRGSPRTQSIDFQTIRLQELVEDEQREAGRVPRTVEVELFADQVDRCKPGDVVMVSGEVRVANTDQGKRPKDSRTMFLLYIKANCIWTALSLVLPCSWCGPRVVFDDGCLPPLTGPAWLELFELTPWACLHVNSNNYQCLTLTCSRLLFTRCALPSMVRPGIEYLFLNGHELVKAGLVLALFGGRTKFLHDQNRIPVRGDPHVLIVGDPGLGKSQMLRAVTNIAPRGVYVCGNTTSTAGLTVTLHKEAGSNGEFALEAGALVLADQGCCCIDEFDKMGNQHQALLEAMEQQCISIAKAGVVCSLPARAAVIAAANPIGGHYDKGRTVSENLKMNPALLSRFDLVFILLDEANEELDRLLSVHVMAMHSSRASRATHTPLPGSLQQFASVPDVDSGVEQSLKDRLRKRPGEPDVDVIPYNVLREYIAYARRHCQPKLSPDAAKLIQEFYIDLRQRHHSADSTPITTRQLESMIRLCEARARLEMRELVTPADARDIIEIMRFTMFDTYCDELGRPDIQRSQNGSGMSKKAAAKRFVSHLNDLATTSYNSLFGKDQLRQVVEDLGLNVGNFEAFIASLNNQGYLLKKGPRSYQLQTLDF